MICLRYSSIQNDLNQLDISELKLADKIMPDIPYIFEKEEQMIAIYAMTGITEIINKKKNDYEISSQLIEKISEITELSNENKENIKGLRYKTKERLFNKIQEKIPNLNPEIKTLIESKAKHKRLIYLLDTFLDYESQARLIKNKPQTINIPFHFAFFFDADDDTVDDRLKEFIECYKDEFNLDDSFKPSQKNSIDGRSIGIFVFTKPEQESGDLEDILLPMVNNKYPELLKESKELIQKYKPAKDKYDEDKAILGVAGQTKNAGVAVHVAIERSDLIPDDELKSNIVVKKIENFFQDMLS